MMRRLSTNRSGGVAIIAALVLPAIIGFGAIGTEVGMWLLTQRRMQGAADAAAVSATFTATSQTTKQNQAYAVAAQNGYSNGVNGVTVSVHTPPTQGNFRSNSKAIEVIIQQPQARLLSALFLGTNPTVAARGVAAPSSGTNGCVRILGTGDTVQVSGNGGIDLSSCDLDGNGNLDVSGNGSVTANEIAMEGSLNKSGNASVSTTKTATYNDQTATSDPYATEESGLTPPGTCNGVFPSSGTATPGCFKGGASVTGTLTMSAGVYYFEGGTFSISGNAVVTATSGVTIVLTSTTANPTVAATFSMAGNATFSITAPGPGLTGQGLAIVQQPKGTAGSTGMTLSGNASLKIIGAADFPNSIVNVSGNNFASSPCFNLISWGFISSGNASFSNGCSGDGTTAFGPESTFKLVE